MRTSGISSNDKPAARTWKHMAILSLTLLMAQVSLMYTCYEAGRIEGMRAIGGFVTEFPYTLNGLHVLISLGLGLCAVGLWLHRATGLFIASAALVFVFVIYGYWHFQTTKYLKEFYADHQNYVRLEAEVGFFHGATRWDHLVLAVVAVLFLWLIFRLTKMALKTGRIRAKS